MKCFFRKLLNCNTVIDFYTLNLKMHYFVSIVSFFLGEKLSLVVQDLDDEAIEISDLNKLSVQEIRIEHKNKFFDEEHSDIVTFSYSDKMKNIYFYNGRINY